MQQPGHRSPKLVLHGTLSVGRVFYMPTCCHEMGLTGSRYSLSMVDHYASNAVVAPGKYRTRVGRSLQARRWTTCVAAVRDGLQYFMGYFRARGVCCLMRNWRSSHRMLVPVARSPPTDSVRFYPWPSHEIYHGAKGVSAYRLFSSFAANFRVSEFLGHRPLITYCGPLEPPFLASLVISGRRDAPEASSTEPNVQRSSDLI